MRTQKCCVCKNKRKDAFLHHFPLKDYVKLKKWLDCIDRDDIKHLTKEKLAKLVVCHKHFEKRFTKINFRLLQTAYPSLFTPEEIASGVPAIPIDDIPNKYEGVIKKRHIDHSYAKEMEPMPKVARFTAAESACTDTVHPMPMETTVIVHPSTSSQARAAESVCTDTVHPMPMETTVIVHPSTSSQARAAESACTDTVHPMPMETTVIVHPSTSSQARAAESACTDTVHPMPMETTVNVHPSTSSQARAAESACTDTVHPMPMETTVIVHPSTSSQARGPRLAILRTPKTSKKRIVNKINNLTPNCAKLYQIYNKSKHQVEYLQRAKRALKFSKNSFEDLTRNMNPYAKKIMKMQINLCTKKQKSYRFTDMEKLIGLSIMKQSPKCYKFLRKIFILPSKTTLNKLIAQLNVEVGINPIIIDVMKKEVATWDKNQKFCSIVFDEMHLDERLNYDQNKDIIHGFTDSRERQKEFADQALVFMLRGAVTKWQQPFAFFFCKGASHPADLKQIIKKVVSAVVEIGLKPIATICDQGCTFRRALGELQTESRRAQIIENRPIDDTVELCGEKLNVIYDPSHIIKGFRNNFLSKTIELDGNVSKWQDIVDVYMTDCYHTETRLLYKLNDHHVIPEKMTNRNKMKVKTAARVLSSTVSAALSYTAQFSHYADGRPVSNTMKNTAKTVKFFDTLFDSINGAALHHKRTKGKELRKAVTANTMHSNFWREAIKSLEKIKFIDNNGKTILVPTIKSCITTIKSLMRLWQYFQKQGLKVMRPRYFNSDPIENFFGQVRAYNFRHNDPDCHSFINTFRSLLVTKIIKFHNDGFNCEDDQTDQLLNLSQILSLKKNVQCEVDTTSLNATSQCELNVPDYPQSTNGIVNQARRHRLEVHSRAYTAGWVVRKLMEKTPCADCKILLTSQSPLPIHKWVSHREFNQSKNLLTYPSEKAVRCFGTVIEVTNTLLENSPQIHNLSKIIISKIKSRMADEISCPKHHYDAFITIIVKFAIHNWCTSINKILGGTDIVRLEKRLTALPPIQKKAYEKYKSKLKNKVTKIYAVVFF